MYSTNRINRLTGDLRDYLKSEGSDLVGFGGVDRLAGAPEIMRPDRYLPDAQSMVSIAIHINEACCDLIARSAHTQQPPPSYYSYQMFTLAAINPELDRIAYLCAKYLESRGFKAYPFPANLPHLQKPSREYPGGPGDISHRHVAVACGLGDIGWHNLLISPQYGSRQKLTTVITNALIEPDPFVDETPCVPERCGFACAHACPTGAIPKDSERTVSLNIGLKKIEYAGIIGWKCRWGCSGMLKCTGGYRDIPIPAEEPTEQELLHYKAGVDPWQQRLKINTGILPYCGRCLAVCPLPL